MRDHKQQVIDVDHSIVIGIGEARAGKGDRRGGGFGEGFGGGSGTVSTFNAVASGDSGTVSTFNAVASGLRRFVQ